MTRPRILLTLIFVISLVSNIQSQDILMTIGDREITLDEFERIYNKNNNTISTNQQTPEEYLDLFIKFKLKVIEAENLGMDTAKKFLDEFNGYKDQLAKPYMTDEETKDFLMKEAYERMKKDVHVSHILLRLPAQPSPEDTLARYNMALEIRQRLLNGEDFETVARATSEDPGVRMNGGDLGYFTVFSMVYPFETASYNLKDGELSMPVRSSNGYHIIKKHGSRPAVGQVKVAHIFIRTPEDISVEEHQKAKELAFSLYDSLKIGVGFDILAERYSDDRTSAAKGGELPYFGTGRMIPEFEKNAFSLTTPGSFCEPFQTFYGWHIIQLIDKQEIGSYEDMESTLQAKALKGDRDRVKRLRYFDKLKDQYQFNMNKDVYQKLYQLMDTSVFKASWNPYPASVDLDEILFTVTDRKVTIGDLVKYFYDSQRNRPLIPIENYVDLNFNIFLEDYLTSMEKESLPVKYPEYKAILQEYHDGILLFDLMDKMVWTKAVQDTIGLEKFFAEHRDNYMWGDRIEAVIVSCDSAADVNALKKKASKIASGKWNAEKLNKKFCQDTLNCITLETVSVEKGRNEHVDALNGKLQAGEVYMENGKQNFVINVANIPPSRKELNETRGQVTSDYQDYLEEEWIKELRNKYPVEVNTVLLSKIN